MFRKAQTVFRKIGDLEGLSAASNNLGDISLSRGNLLDAQRELSDSIPGYKAVEDNDGLALALSDLAEVSRLRGNLDSALASYEKAKEAATEIGDKRALGYVLNGIGEVLVDRGDLVGAKKAYQESFSIRREIADQQTVAETELSLARLAIDNNEAGAEAAIRKCQEQFHQNGQVDDELLANATLVDALLEETRYSDALKEAASGAAVEGKSLNSPIRLEFALAWARAESASGELDLSRTHFASLLHDARSHDLMGAALEVRLAMAELEVKSGKEETARADFFSLQKAAHAKGFGLIEGKALAELKVANQPRMPLTQNRSR